MRKPELAAAIAEKADLTKDQANRVLNAVLEEITGALNRKDSVTLVGFGTFVQRHRGARTGKNPQTGQPVKIKASNTVAFKPGKSLKDAVNWARYPEPFGSGFPCAAMLRHSLIQPCFRQAVVLQEKHYNARPSSSITRPCA